MLKFSNLLWYLRHNVLMLSPTADGVVLHRLLCNVNSVRGQVHLGFACVLASHLVNIALELHSVPHPRLFGNVNLVGGQVHLGCASVYLPPTLLTLP